MIFPSEVWDEEDRAVEGKKGGRGHTLTPWTNGSTLLHHETQAAVVIVEVGRWTNCMVRLVKKIKSARERKLMNKNGKIWWIRTKSVQGKTEINENYALDDRELTNYCVFFSSEVTIIEAPFVWLPWCEDSTRTTWCEEELIWRRCDSWTRTTWCENDLR